MIWQQTSIEKIKTELVLSCINNDPESFLPFLMLAEVETEAPNKKDFYQFFKGMINQAHESSEGKLTLKIEQPTLDTDKEVLNYNFYDNTHKYPLLSIVVKENNNLMYLGVMPF
ncbi:hypothetical protein E0I26_01145 [Flavobacterium rhamnosiphilum]|uniref:Uncharacterized protein n=1 Tax=Flavobacterium rhamnosiphilum TaxID=2541724 RepID=A0A4R5FBV0_9FLAO|nr:hypothetical protein [Flavobacterium rhamnosiphilum]TDE46719.1 hypothetical protein E0I26_01145 [Flavobacterium rhamnosiphilum]